MKMKFVRWLLAAACSFIGFAQAQTINKIEYFFDTDPGVGNGMVVTFSPVTSLDSTFTFDVSALSNGVHMVYVRSMDANNKWSMSYSSSFIKTGAPGGALTIIKLEYFIDSDPGFGNATNIPISAAGLIDSTFNFTIPDNGTDLRFLVIRAMDSYGQWNLLYYDSISMCDLYRSKPNFSWVRYGNNFSFVDSSLNNPTHKLLWKFANLGTDSVSNPQFTFPQGNYLTELVAGTGCRKDSITFPLFTGLEKYYPDSALAGGNIAMAFFGGGLDTTAVFSVSNGSGTFTPIGKIKVDPMLTMALFDFHTVSPGNYNVNIHFPNGYDTTIYNGLRIIAAPGGVNYEPDINITFAGPTLARRGSTVKVDMIITNNGGMLAEQVPVSFTISRDGAGLLEDYSYRANYITPPYPSIPFQDSLPHYTALDSLHNQPYNGRMHNLIVPFLNAGESFVVPIYVYIPLNATEGSITEITAWAGERMLGSPFREQWGNCVDLVVDFAVGFIPGVSCVNSAWNYFAYGQYGYGSPTVQDWGWNTAGLLLSCIPGANVGTAVSKSKAILNVLEHPKAFADIGHNTTSAFTGTGDACGEVKKWDREEIRRNHHRIAVDPNEIDGPEGFTSNRYIKGTGKNVYWIGFENLPTAAANAQRVYIADTLDKSKFDLHTFELLSYSIGDTTFMIPLQRKEYTQTVDLVSSTGLNVRFNAKLDTATGILRFSFLSIDPATRDTLFGSDIRGFLPPDTNGKSGRGYVAYGVMMKSDLITNDEVKNRASIIFDYNAPILTNTWLNTIDKTAPVGSVSGGTLINDTTVRLNLTGTDGESGIRGYGLYISENMKPYVKLGPVFGDTVRFTGLLDSTYRFYAIPYDSAYNEMDKSPVAEYTITFSYPLPVTIISFDAQKQQKDVSCKWQTTDEINLSEYTVERSIDGVRYETAGTVTAQNSPGIKNYQLKDVNALTIFSQYKRLYYRLKMVDIDRTSKYSRVARIDMDKKYTVAVFPNPAGKEIFVQGIQHYHRLQVIDMNGRIIMNEAIKPGTQSINIETLVAGNYILKLFADDDSQTLKFIKN